MLDVHQAQPSRALCEGCVHLRNGFVALKPWGKFIVHPNLLIVWGCSSPSFQLEADKFVFEMQVVGQLSQVVFAAVPLVAPVVGCVLLG